MYICICLYIYDLKFRDGSVKLSFGGSEAFSFFWGRALAMVSVTWGVFRCCEGFESYMFIYIYIYIYVYIYIQKYVTLKPLKPTECIAGDRPHGERAAPEEGEGGRARAEKGQAHA